MRRATALQLVSPLLQQKGRAAMILALSAFGSATAICTATGLAWMAATVSPGVLSSALVACVTLSAGSLAAGWWAVDRLAA